jgi:hypothetical protein
VVEQIVERVRAAKLRCNALLLSDTQQKTKRDRLGAAAALQQMRAILVAELHDINIFPEDAFDRLYRISTEDPENPQFMEELTFLEYCLSTTAS